MSSNHSRINSSTALGLSALNSSDIVIVEEIDLYSDSLSVIESKLSESSRPKLIKVDPYSDLSKIVEDVVDLQVMDTRVTILVSSNIILQLLPMFTRISRPKASTESGPNVSIVLNVAVTSQNTGFLDASKVFAFSDLSCPIISASTPQECYDFLLFASVAASVLRVPVINYFDSDKLNSSALSNVDASHTMEEIIESYDSKLNSLVEAKNAQFVPMEIEGNTEAPTEAPKPTNSELLQLALDSSSLKGRSVSYYGSSSAKTVFVSISDYNLESHLGNHDLGYLRINVYRPFPTESILALLPFSVNKLVFLEQVNNVAKVWGDLLFDFSVLLRNASFNEGGSTRPTLIDVQSSRSIPLSLSKSKDFDLLAAEVESSTTSRLVNLDNTLGYSSDNIKSESSSAMEVEGLSEMQISEKLPYQQILLTAFKDRLSIVNSADPKTIWGKTNTIETNPEYGFGVVLFNEQKRQTLYKLVLDFLAQTSSSDKSELHVILNKWVESFNSSNNFGPSFHDKLSQILEIEIASPNASPLLSQMKALSNYFDRDSNWLIGSDQWAVDIGNSGVHHVLASNVNINMLILDTSDYSKNSESGDNINDILKKKDIGLYALNYGGAYVASISAYSSYTQSLAAILEADSFPGPSVVLAHLPHSTKKLISPSYSSIETMKLSKLAVDSGKWPLYRYLPNSEGEGSFTLDSDKLRNEIQSFLDRSNTLAMISETTPKFYSGADESLESRSAKASAKAAKDDLDRLMAGLQGPAITVLYASDNCNAEDVARRVHRGAKQRHMNSEISTMDDFDFDEIEFKSTIVFVVSTAGQGEFPANGRAFWKTLSSASINLSNLKYAVFGIGDREYWPRKEDAIYFNKPSKDLDKKLSELNAVRLLDLGLGDDQDDDGFETGFGKWFPELWASLGVNMEVDDSVALDDEPPKITDEENKINSNYLRGNIVSELLDDSKGNVDDFTGKLLKFHGTYGQDDRDLRASRIEAGLSPAYSFMIRVRLPGGKTTTDQWLAMDELSTKYGNDTMKITTRQTFQLHGVLKSNLRTTINLINKSLLDTIAACGDVNRNVVASANPLQTHLREDVYNVAKLISDSLLPKSTAFHEIWVADKMVAGQAVQDFEPLLGQSYLPRKFKVAIAIPPENDVDVFAYDLGLIAILNSNEEIVGFNVAIGGGMGMTHNNKKTYPRITTVIGYVDRENLIEVVKGVVMVQRDYGDRVNRKHARMKYTIDDHGVEWFKEQIESYSKIKLGETRPYTFNRNGDRYGWVDSVPGFKNYTMFIQNGRVADIPGYPLKTALKTIAKVHKGFFQLTCNSHLIIADVPNDEVDEMDALLRKLNVHNKNLSGMRLHSMACTSLPTCGLAMAESERYLPSLITLFEDILDENGLRNDAIVTRMTGCPNGCARPYIAEIGLVGKAPGAYNLYLGGAHNGSRLNKIYRESINEEQIIGELKPIIKSYALERLEGESFGDYVIRSGIVKETIQGLDFHS
ncbi:Sulfite reductase [NADPH] subunit beta [Smittium mucronatum]|uniref:assimilatory sulfite reductase (NADPH) n=1 Tax=Smittium mucronatum TaxID=133383 RepID=A0A1R0GL53_9FUNG|nr:Sulfite reductase [NADPH] subunit beta [Smittium mucronatum]